MMLAWFDAREAKHFGASLAKFYIDRIPLEDLGKKKKRPGKNVEVLNKLVQQIEKFKLDHKMNFFKKAQFGNAFRWALVEAGYDPDFADELTRSLLLKF